MTDEKQPEALILADAIEDGSEAHDKAAAELRRQHEVIQTLTAALVWIANVSASDYQYQRVASEALNKAKEMSND